MSRPIDLSVVIPVFRSTHSVKQLLADIDQLSYTHSLAVQVVLVDDGNVASVTDYILSLDSSLVELNVLRLCRNYGQQAAIVAGLEYCVGEYVVTMDDDMQHDPADIPILISKLKEGYDVCYGTPNDMVHGPVRSYFSRTIKLSLSKVSGVPSLFYASAFRVLKADIARKVIQSSKYPVNIDAVLSWYTDKVSHVLITHRVRPDGRSTYSFQKLVEYTFRLIVSHTVLPLRITVFVGMVFVLISLLLVIMLFAKWLINGSVVPGFTFLACTIALLSGIQLLVTGVLGEYLAILFTRNSGAPLYSVSSIAKKKRPD